jgi:ABC-type transporter Mla subunit MlaD
MGLADRLRQLTKQAKDTAAGHKDQLDQALRQAATTADQRTSGKYHDQIARAESKAAAYVDNLQPPAPAGQPAEEAGTTGETPRKSAD